MYILFGHCYVLLRSVLTDLFNGSKVLKLWGAPTEEALLVLCGGGGDELFAGGTIILDEIWAQDKICIVIY
jgi:hypothetical protein